jgi:hypothetical protein
MSRRNSISEERESTVVDLRVGRHGDARPAS